jgi:hypothetical protein
MRSALLLPLLLVGCQSAHSLCPPACLPAPTCSEQPCPAPCVAAPPPAPPRVEVKCPEEIHVKAPPQKVVVNIPKRREAVEERLAAPPAPAQEVLLVPRTVYVPYVAQTPTAPVRMVGLEAPPALVPQRFAALPECRPPQQGAPSTKTDLDELNQRLERLEAALERVAQPEAERLPPPADCTAPVCPPTPSPCLPRLRRNN